MNSATRQSGGVCEVPGERCNHPISCERGGCVKQRTPSPAATDFEQRMDDMVRAEDRAIAAAASTPFEAHCSTCGHDWVAAYLPMPLERFAEVARVTRCPKGCRSRALVGPGTAQSIVDAARGPVPGVYSEGQGND